MKKVRCAALFVVYALLLTAGCASISEPRTDAGNLPSVEGGTGESTDLASDVEGSRGELSGFEESLAIEIAASLQTTGAVLTRVGVPATDTAGVVFEVPSLAGLDKRDVFRALDVFLKRGWSGELTVNIEEHLQDGTVSYVVYSLFDEEGRAVLERYEGRATSPKDSVRTPLPTGRLEDVTSEMIREVATGSSAVPDFEQPQ